jgi:carbonic anhydrase
MPNRFATILTCIDGRVQHPLSAWTKNSVNVDYVDTITEPGPCSVVAAADDAELAAILAKVRISQDAHGSDVLVLAGHADCAGSPIPEEQQYEQLRAGAARLARHLPGTRVIAVHAGRCGADRWEPSVLLDLHPA